LRAKKTQLIIKKMLSFNGGHFEVDLVKRLLRLIPEKRNILDKTLKSDN